MTENEAVERMARSLSLASCGQWDQTDQWNRAHWRDIARIALTSHPAVEALREWERFASKTIEDLEPNDPLRVHMERLHGPRLQCTRTVLASLPKDTDAQR